MEGSKVAGAQVLPPVLGLPLQEGQHGVLAGQLLTPGVLPLRGFGVVVEQSGRIRTGWWQLERSF
jgi:hypothetical protein